MTKKKGFFKRTPTYFYHNISLISSDIEIFQTEL